MKKLLLLLLLVPLISFSQHNVNLDELDQYYNKMVKDWDVPSMAIAVIQDGEVIHSKAYGVIEDGKDTQADSNSLYAIASNSKAFTATILAMLVEEGKVSWDDKVQQYIPYFQLYDPWVSAETTIKDLLCHRVGLGTFSGDIIWYKSSLSSEAIIRNFKDIPQDYNFRDGYGYSNLMYITAGQVIKEVTGKSWSENVHERIFTPLGMNRTITSPNDLKDKGNYATPHARKDNENIPIDWVDWQEIGALGGIISSVNDLSKWMTFNMNHGVWMGDTLLSSASINKLWTPHNNFPVNHTSRNDFAQKFNGYGLGWKIGDYRDKMLVGHTGGYDGMISAFHFLPDEKTGVIVLTNGSKSPIMAATYYTLDKLLGVENPKDWSANHLKRVNQRAEKDEKAIEERKANRIKKTKPSLLLDDYAGTYHSSIYGNIEISVSGKNLKIKFEHSPDLSATLTHWHYDVFKIEWDNIHAWFDFGTVQFNMDNNLKITGIDFDVPNHDIFFEELKAKRIEN